MLTTYYACEVGTVAMLSLLAPHQTLLLALSPNMDKEQLAQEECHLSACAIAAGVVLCVRVCVCVCVCVCVVCVCVTYSSVVRRGGAT